MNRDGRAYCVLCSGTEETTITGPLSTKEDVTAHQNCLLYASGICCSNTPQFDDLFGFSVQDVKTEVNRGRKLSCSQCKRRGATAGCEVRRCKKSFHYPCAIEEGARVFEDACTVVTTVQQKMETLSMDPKHRLPGSPVNPSYCPACKKTEKTSVWTLNLIASWESSRSKWSPSSSGDSSCTTIDSLKRQLNFTEQTEEERTPSKKNKKRNRITSDDDSTGLAVGGLIPPLDSDSDEIGGVLKMNESPEPLINSEDSDEPSELLLANQKEVEPTSGDSLYFYNSDSNSLLDPLPEFRRRQSDAGVPTQSKHSERRSVEIQTIKREIEDLSCEENPIYRCEQDPGESSAPEQNLIKPSPFPSQPESQSQSQSQSISSSYTVALCQPLSVNYLSIPSPPHAPASNTPPSPPPAVVSDPPQAQSPPPAPEPSVDSTSFWRNCNAASCTRTIFSEFIKDMKELSTRILCDQASQDDYDRALSVMLASGKLAEFVSRQQEELQRKQEELQKEAAAMKDVVSALRK